jgi:hypothetical protein
MNINKLPRLFAILSVAPALLIFDLAWCGSEAGYSTLYGLGAGFHNSADGNENTFIGYYAGYNTTTGTNNVFVGSRAGAYDTLTGSLNTFVGYDAGADVTSGQKNTFLGAVSGTYNTTGFSNTFVGNEAGKANFTGYYATYVGDSAGWSNDGGQFNTALGTYAGFGNTSGSFNTYLGAQSGQKNIGGSGNIFIGNAAGYTETGSNKLYIDNCLNGNPCTPPFIYGEFDNHLLNVNGVLNVAANGASRSQLHFSLGNADSGGFLTSVLENNFFMSSGARWDNGAGGWVQRSSDQQSVIQGSGSLGYRVFTSSGHGVGSTFTPATRLLIDYNGLFALNANSTVSGHEIHTSSGAYLTTAGVWTNASSREYKDNVHSLTAAAAEKTLEALDPVTFTYKNDGAHERVGFIAEDVPELVAMPDRKGLSPMDIVAVLTKVVQEQKQELAEQDRQVANQQRQITDQRHQLADQAQELQAERSRGDTMEKRLLQLAAEVERLKARSQ